MLEATMKERDPNLVPSSLSGTFTKNGVTVEVSIIRLENKPDWTLEVINSSGTSIVWDDQFSSDEAAHAEFQRSVAEEGMTIFLETGNVIPFKR
jgi:hypothetical protein